MACVILVKLSINILKIISTLKVNLEVTHLLRLNVLVITWYDDIFSLLIYTKLRFESTNVVLDRHFFLNIKQLVIDKELRSRNH